MGFGALTGRIARLVVAGPLLAAIVLALAFGLPTPRAAEALDSEEQAFLVQLNDYRAQNGLVPLQINETLNGVARWMANDMATKNYFSHTDSLGRDPFARMDQLGYAYNTWRGENLVAGTETAPYAFQMWKDSPGHNANMLGANYTVVGIARVFNPNSSYGWYWATEFGGVGGATPEPAPPPQPVVTQAPAPPRQPATFSAPPVTIAEPVQIVPPPAAAPVEEALPPPEAPIAWSGPLFPQTPWWRTLDVAPANEPEVNIFAAQLLRISPALEELFLVLLRAA
jgi:uncharacterized protein YkwD